MGRCALCGHNQALREENRLVAGQVLTRRVCKDADACRRRHAARAEAGKAAAARYQTLHPTQTVRAVTPGDPVRCVRCGREVDRVQTVIGEHGLRLCADAPVCAHTRLTPQRRSEDAA